MSPRRNVASLSVAELAVPIGTEPMEARLVDDLPVEPGWQFEPKWDGFRCLAFRTGDKVDLRAKSGKPIARYFPEVMTHLKALPLTQFVIDGELAIPIGANLSFDALQMRLHPAESRVRRLSVETPAIYILFDMLLTPEGTSLLDEPLAMRRAALEEFYASVGANDVLRLSPYTLKLSDAKNWLRRAAGALDGVVAKRVDGRYLPGERAMLKVKQRRTADCVVGGFRYGAGRSEVGSLLLGLYDDAGKLDHVGFTSTITNREREALTKRLEALISPPGFTGNAPGGPSRWSAERTGEWQPLKPKLVVEVQYDQITGDRFRHGTKLLRWRPDKRPQQCTFAQLTPEKRPAVLLKKIIEA
jgi:ATP-dependent DNA ligase